MRDIEIFLTLAEELHFGKTAEKLRITPARVSQAIKKQERRVQATLFERTSRSVVLTPIGRGLYEDLKQAQHLIDSGLTRARAASRSVTGTLRIAVMSILGLYLNPVIEAFNDRYPDCTVELVDFPHSEPFTALRAKAADLGLIWLPVREPDLSVGPVAMTEGRVLATPTTSELAGRAAITMEDLAGCVFPELGNVPRYWAEGMLPATTPSGVPIARGPEAASFFEVLPLIMSGAVVSPMNAHVAWTYTPPNITYIPIVDAPDTEWALVWLTAGENAAIRAFVETAREFGVRTITNER
ncbi:LysR family transcriptional regulator [Nocardia sp. CDC160]|uniref:LysR substrate-binding domain-containing protein n=1 Tax=Nocardia sp. CDC160 TaxID=3112166 RepID=UPI002DBF3CD4|nr:LysR family transcriptional regulator [Nocardia sp. CDC160]MEC3914560.1 LysR family transcriptional regulator [Nocardia sp. CDC160]